MTLHFDRKRILVISTGLILTGVLTFSAGVVTGIVLWTPTRAEIAALNNAGKAAGTAKLPAVPALASAASGAQAAAAELNKLPGAGAAAAPPTATPSDNPQPASAQSPEAPAVPQQQPPAPIPAAPQNATPPQSVRPAQPAAGATQDQVANAQDAFSLQLGSFLDAKNAKQLQSDLKERGYAASIFTAMDSEQREWHVVRIGGYKTLASAAQAAASFNNKERMQALIRRSDAL